MTNRYLRRQVGDLGFSSSVTWPETKSYYKMKGVLSFIIF